MTRGAAVLVLALVLVNGCERDDTTARESDAGRPAVDAGPAPDAGPTLDAGPPAPGWESVEVTTDDGEILIERVTYRSGSLLIHGQVCRPAGDGPRPLVVYNHGGWLGLGTEWNGGVCADTARMLGWAVIESSYRGEDGSEGEIELCLGEVDDVLAMLAIARTLPWADPDRVGMTGASHGGCVTLRAVQRGAPVKIASAAVPPTDMSALHAYWTARVEAGTADTIESMVLPLLERAAGGAPDEVPEAYRARSPLAFAADLASFSGPLQILGGVADTVIPPSEPCALGELLAGTRAYHVNDMNDVVGAPAAGCEAYALDWRSEPRPGGWPDARYLVMYDGLGHDLGIGGPREDEVGADWAGFFLGRL